MVMHSPSSKRRARSDWPVVAGLAALVMVLALASLATGPAAIAWIDTARAALGMGDPSHIAIIQDIRAPRTLLALAVGGMLGLAGAAMQGFVRNPLAEPSLLGTSNAAAFGAVAAIYFAAGTPTHWLVPLSALAAALIANAVLFAVAGRDGRVLTLILAGIALSSLASALTALALNLAPSPFAALEIAFWLLGSLSDRSFDHVWIALPPMAVATGLILYDARALQALTLGEDTARTLGITMALVKLRLALAIALGVGAAVAVAGAIGFIGLIVPHLVRPLVGYDPGRLLVPSALAGAALLTAADILVRVLPTGTELKLGVVTALIGVPFFALLIWRERTGRPAFL